jgi:hypothetical protein
MTKSENAAEIKAQMIVLQIINATKQWTVDMWFDFRNVFHPDYYDTKASLSKRSFNEWKIKEIIKYNSLLIRK